MDNNIRQIAFFGKGGIGKSTISSNVAAALAEKGLKVLMVGCDPKSDCTRNLRGDREIPTISEVLRTKVSAQLGLNEIIYGKDVAIDEVVFEGYQGVLCAEAGGPAPKRAVPRQEWAVPAAAWWWPWICSNVSVCSVSINPMW